VLVLVVLASARGSFRAVCLPPGNWGSSRVTYDSWDCGGVFQVHTQDGIIEFKPCERGLHYHNVSDDESNIGLMLVNTVRGNFEEYTRKEIKRAREARRIQGMIANPTEREFSAMVCEKLLANCPVTVQDVNNAHHIYGRDLTNIWGKTTRRKSEYVQVDYVQIPRDFCENAQVRDTGGRRNVCEWLAILGHFIKRNKFSNN
jgi:hypothetical protein